MKAYTERVFGKVDGKDVLAYRFETEAGYQLEIMTYGATILRYVLQIRLAISPMLS